MMKKQEKEVPKDQPKQAEENSTTEQDITDNNEQKLEPAEGAVLTGFETSDSTGNRHF